MNSDGDREKDNIYSEIKRAIDKAFIDDTIDSYHSLSPALIYNDESKNKKVISTLRDELCSCDEFAISVAFITESGLQLLKETFKELLSRGVKGRILTTDYLCFTEPKALKSIRDHLPNIEVRMYKTLSDEKKSGFHTKGYLMRQGSIYKMIIGSSNLTATALSTNKEWNTKIISTEEGEFSKEICEEFDSLWERATPLDEYLDTYEEIYDQNKEKLSSEIISSTPIKKLEPNYMQISFCEQFQRSIDRGDRRGLLISSTGTGKTYASAFALKKVNARKVLFLAHRTQLLAQAIASYEQIMSADKRFCLLSGDKSFAKNLEGVTPYDDKAEYDFLMATCEMMGKDEILGNFPEDMFDYVIIDEVHRAGSPTYRKIIDHFKPKYLLGMTATPERTEDETLIYDLFDHNILFEIRLNDAIEYDLLCPFHYYGITDLQDLDYNSHQLKDFRLIDDDKKVDCLIRESEYYGFSGDRLRCLIFVSNKRDGEILEEKINQRRYAEQNRNYRARFICGDTSESERAAAIDLLEKDDTSGDFLDFIITIDIFNEGIDIPDVNQIIMLRPTMSSIIFLQQLGRGLRKWKDKEFVVVIDFIGNYDNNYMIPKAFASSADKEDLAMLVTTGYLPGISSIEFDEIAKEKIFRSLQKVNLDTMSTFKDEYRHLKNKLNRIPSLVDFLDHTDFDPARLFLRCDSYLDFLLKMRELDDWTPTDAELDYLAVLTRILAKGLREDEALFIKTLINNQDIDRFIDSHNFSTEKLTTIRNEFIDIFFNKNGKTHPLIDEDDRLTSDFKDTLTDTRFRMAVDDLIEFSLRRHDLIFKEPYQDTDFSLFSRYSRDDVSILLNLPKTRSSTLYGYQYLKEADAFPIFVNYVKSADISEATRYEDYFIDPKTFSWNSRHGEREDSKNMSTLINQKTNGLRVYLFIRKSIDERGDKSLHYFLGEMYVKEHHPIKRNGKDYVHFIFSLRDETRQDIYDFLKTEIK